jgi:lysyl-tRNA synthetase class 2
MEVETPVLSRAAATDLNCASFMVASAGGDRYLHTSPEFSMKRLLAARVGDIYQICKAFRTGETGRYHNPEFSLVEWYRLDFDHFALMDEVELLLEQLLEGSKVFAPAKRITYRAAFTEYTGLDVLTASVADCAHSAASSGIEVHDNLDLRQWLELMMSHVIVPACARAGFTFIYDFPVDQAALARIRPGSPPVAERFELIGYGLELANGFHELTDAGEQRARFERELQMRRQAGLTYIPPDEHLLQALAQGLPDCSGVAVGLDRLVILAAGLDQISETTAFSWENA